MIPSHVLTVLTITNYVIVLMVIEHILRTRRDPAGMVSWILALLLLPVLGPMLYVLIGQVPLRRKIRRRRRRLRKISRALSTQTKALAEAYRGREEDVAEGVQRDLIRLATRVSGATVTRGNEVTVYHDGEQAFLALGLAIEAAQSHIHMMYYIFANDETGRAMRDLLVRKAREGVEVRLLVDALGSWSLSREFVAGLREAGVQVAFFLPWQFMRRQWQLNFRNHRKLTVIDGQYGFFGSKNIADEYLGRKKKYGTWRDTTLKVSGPCVAQLQEVFVEDWHYTTRKDLLSDRYFPAPATLGNTMMQVVASGPDHRPDVMHQLLFAAVTDARQSVTLLTPYFVPDAPMVVALSAAAYRGVRVQILVPTKTDNKLVLWAGRSFYAQLLETGIEIFEYDLGMLHSKEVIVDQRWAMVTSANMDVRSFTLNFELTGLLYDPELAGLLLTSFDDLCAHARRIQRRDVQNWKYLDNLAAGVARLATPLL